MNKVFLDPADIIDLIFSKKTICGDYELQLHGSAMSILNAVQQKLIYGEPLRKKNSKLCGISNANNFESRARAA